MNRRNFMKLLGLTPFAGLLGCEVKLIAKKPNCSPIISRDMTLEQAWEAVEKLENDYYITRYNDRIHLAKKCDKCRNTGRLWSTTIKDDPDCILTPQTYLSVRSCDCKSGTERTKRLNG